MHRWKALITTASNRAEWVTFDCASPAIDDAKAQALSMFGAKAVNNITMMHDRSWSDNGASSFRSSSRRSTSGQTDLDVLSDMGDGVGETLGFITKATAKGIWNLGKYGVRKYKEGKELREQQEIADRVHLFEELQQSPHKYNVKWLLKPNGIDSIVLKGQIALAIIVALPLAKEVIIDHLDDADSEQEHDALKDLLDSTTHLCNLFEDEEATHFSSDDEGSITVNAEEASLIDLAKIINIVIPIYQTGQDSGELELEDERVLKRLKIAIEVISSRNEGAAYVDAMPEKTFGDQKSLAQYNGGKFPKIKHNADSVGDNKSPDEDIEIEDQYKTHDESQTASPIDNFDADLNHNPIENILATSSKNLTNQEKQVTKGPDEVHTFTCIWYEKEGFRLSPNPEGTLIVSSDAILFMEANLDLLSAMTLLTNSLVENSEARWIVKPNAIKSVTIAKVSFRTAYVLNTDSGESYKLVFMPGKGNSVLEKLQKYGAQI